MTDFEPDLEESPDNPDPEPDPEDEEVPTTDVEEVSSERLPLSEVAQQAAVGEWGIGQDRRRRLAEAGYDPREVDREIVRLRNR